MTPLQTETWTELVLSCRNPAHARVNLSVKRRDVIIAADRRLRRWEMVLRDLAFSTTDEATRHTIVDILGES